MNYDNFANRFLGVHRFPQKDLWDGAAISVHDAVAAAAKAALDNPSRDATTVANFIANITCKIGQVSGNGSAPGPSDASVPGASGSIAFAQGTGNQVNKALPIVSISAAGALDQIDLVWSLGGQHSCS